LPPYLTVEPAQSRVPSTFGLHYPLLIARVHRRAGMLYVVAAVLAAASGMVIGAATPFGPILAVSNVLLASLWLWFTVRGYLSGRRRRYCDHRRHMVRSATLALSIISNRIWTPVLFIGLRPLQDSAFGGSEEQVIWLVAGLGGFLGWTIPLCAVQWWLRHHPVMSPSSISKPVDTQPV
jgi:hypothetical protein